MFTGGTTGKGSWRKGKAARHEYREISNRALVLCRWLGCRLVGRMDGLWRCALGSVGCESNDVRGMGGRCAGLTWGSSVRPAHKNRNTGCRLFFLSRKPVASLSKTNVIWNSHGPTPVYDEAVYMHIAEDDTRVYCMHPCLRVRKPTNTTSTFHSTVSHSEYVVCEQRQSEIAVYTHTRS